MNIAFMDEYGGHQFIRDSEIANAHRFIVITPQGHSIQMQSEEGARAVAEQCSGKWYLGIEPQPERIPQSNIRFEPNPTVVGTIWADYRPAA